MPIMLSFPFARNLVFKHLPSPQACLLSLSEACGRILAEDVDAVSDSPDFNKSIMDGFALRSQDASACGARLRIKGAITAGKPFEGSLRSGECLRIATGAVLPAGTDTVLRKEDARVDGEYALTLKACVRGEYVLTRGREYKKGARLLKKGALLGPAQQALLAAQGIRAVKVFRRPAVAILTTGSELAVRSSAVSKGFIRDASGPMLVSAFRQMGIEPVLLGKAADRMPLLERKIARGLACDILITTGGVSVGEKDLLPQALSRNGVVCHFHKVSIRPGKPLWFGTKGRSLIFALPGNPISTLIGFLLFVRPAIEKMQGQGGDLVFSEGILARAVYNEDERLSFLPGRLKQRKGRNVVIPTDFKGSSDILSVARADGFFVMDPLSRKKRGERVSFLKI